MEFTQKAVKAGSDTKGDVLVTLELTECGGRELEIHSKVEKMYSNAIEADVVSMLDAYEIANVKVLVNDLGAFDFAIKARTETAIKRARK